jgi:hypothetical protein
MTTHLHRGPDADTTRMTERVIITERNTLAVVEAYATYATLKGVSEPVIVKLRIVGRRSNGMGKPYVAHLEPCQWDLCREGLMTPCEKPNNHLPTVNAWVRHIQTHCHGWHAVSVRRFMGEVLATYSAKTKPKRPTVGVPQRRYRERHYADREVTE